MTTSPPTRINWKDPRRTTHGDLAITNQPRDHRRIPPTIKAKLSEIRRWPLFLYGATGRGKSCAALCVGDASKTGCVYRTVPDMLDQVRAVSYGEAKRLTESASHRWLWWRGWQTHPVVILDEIGARKEVSDYHYECVYRAIDCRQDRPSIFISNLNHGELRRVYDNRVASRLAAGTKIFFDEDEFPDMRMEQ